MSYDEGTGRNMHERGLQRPDGGLRAGQELTHEIISFPRHLSSALNSLFLVLIHSQNHFNAVQSRHKASSGGEREHLHHHYRSSPL